jgi:hypothetical protein
VISYAAGETPGTIGPDIVDPTDWIIFAFRLESSPIVIAPDSDADCRRIIGWIEAHPEQLSLYEHALTVVFGCESYEDFLRLAAGEEGDDDA